MRMQSAGFRESKVQKLEKREGGLSQLAKWANKRDNNS